MFNEFVTLSMDNLSGPFCHGAIAQEKPAVGIECIAILFKYYCYTKTAFLV